MTILRVYLIKSVLPKTTRIYGSSFVHLVHTLFKCNSIGYACHDAIFFNYFIFVLQSEILYAFYFFKQQLFISVDFCCFLYVFLHFVADVVVSHSESIISYHVHVFYTHLFFIYYLKQRNLLPNTNMFWLTFFCIISLHVWLFFVHRISCYSQFVKQDAHGIVQIDSFGAVTQAIRALSFYFTTTAHQRNQTYMEHHCAGALIHLSDSILFHTHYVV